MLLIFPPFLKLAWWVTICMGWGMSLHSTVHHFSADALALLQQQAVQEPGVTIRNPVKTAEKTTAC